AAHHGAAVRARLPRRARGDPPQGNEPLAGILAAVRFTVSGVSAGAGVADAQRTGAARDRRGPLAAEQHVDEAAARSRARFGTNVDLGYEAADVAFGDGSTVFADLRVGRCRAVTHHLEVRGILETVAAGQRDGANAL